MKVIKYQFMTEVNHGTKEEPNIEQIFTPCEIRCSDEAFESNYAIAQSEAVEGTIIVEDIPNPATEPTEVEQLRADVDYIAMETGVEL